jgi:hypothetical protein
VSAQVSRGSVRNILLLARARVGHLISAFTLLALSSCSPEVVGSLAPPTGPPQTGPKEIRPLSGDGQVGFIGQLLGQPLRARVYDSVGIPYPGIAVNWSVNSGGGQFDQAQTTTDTTGTAYATWILGDSVGTQLATVAGSDIGSVTFTSNARPELLAITISPSTVTLLADSSQQFNVTGQFSDGTAGPVTVDYTATGGTITSSGVYTAGTRPGTFQVSARVRNGSLTATAIVSITDLAATLQSIALAPTNPSVTVAGTVQFTVSGRMSDGSTIVPQVSYSATGGSITSTGLYTAGSTTGSFTASATVIGGTLSAQSTIKVLASTEPVFNAAVNTLIYQDAFDSYSGSPGGSWGLTPTGVSVISPGLGGAGKAARVTYTPSDFYGALDLLINDSPHIFVSYFFRTDPGFDPAADDDTGSGMKWFTLWRGGGAGRQTWGVGGLTFGQGHTNLGVHDNSSTRMPNPGTLAGGNSSPSGYWYNLNDGNWHRYTIEAYTGTGTDGYERCWVDGVKIFDTTGKGYDRSTLGFNEIKFPSDMVRPPMQVHTVDIDNFISWTP